MRTVKPHTRNQGMTISPSKFFSLLAISLLSISVHAQASSASEPNLVLDFESGFDNWVRTQERLHLRMGSTTTNGTGPMGASEGTRYAFMETSTSGANSAGDRAILTSPLLNLDGYTIAFDYHMFGSDIGELKLQMQHNSGGAWQTILEREGQQHARSSASWSRISAGSSGVVGNARFRFVAVAAGGGRGDIAIDNVVIDLDINSGNDVLTGFNGLQAFRNSFDGTSIALTTGNSPSVGDIQLIWNGSYYDITTVATVNGWQTAAIEVVLSDVNLDGATDAILRNVDAAITAISGVHDQILYANGNGSAATAITAIDDEFQSFFNDVYSWMLNPDYFEENSTPLIGETKRLWSIFDNVIDATIERAGCTIFYLSSCHFDVDSPLGWIPQHYDGQSCSSLIGFKYDLGYYTTDPTIDTRQEVIDAICRSTDFYIIYSSEDVEVGRDYSMFNQDALAFAAEVGLAFQDGSIAAATDPEDAVIILEEILGVEIGDTVAGVLNSPLPFPELPPETSPVPERRLPRPLPDAANDSWNPRATSWVILRGTWAGVLCGLFCSNSAGDPDADEEFEWRDIGIEWAVQDVSDSDVGENEQPQVVIGEGEGPERPYERIPNAARDFSAIFFDLGVDDQGNPIRFTSEQWTTRTNELLWSMNSGWLWTMELRQALFIDIGRFNGRDSRGEFYECEREQLAVYPHRQEEFYQNTTAGHDVEPCGIGSALF